ncbi:MAG: SulP family inorganic anion transporter [Erysipelotrichia bacterium]|nr:SulP family inorganic anion transporter [Erysipelotrichia bacterium]NCC55172.1 SulP family inorganic anion transporter [Erysipelotrichia bacterium]
MIKEYLIDLKREFKGYNANQFIKDLLAGLTVAAVALPLALAFGVSSGADAGAGLITAIIAGLLIGTLSGASYQISGPTGAMSAILISLSTTYGLQGVFIASLLSGVILVIASIFKFGKMVSFIPTSVITGFTSGIAIIIATGQIDNFFGTASVGENTIEKLLSYFTLGFPIAYASVFFGLLVIAIMILWPKKWNAVFPSSLAGIIIALIVNLVGNFNVAEVGAIPSTLLPEVRLNVASIDLASINHLLFPAVSIAALGMIESLLCGASAGKMKNEKLNADRELMAQGIGNIVIPFFGGVPATAAIARTSVAIKAGGQTRLVSVIHAIVLLISMFALGPLMSKIPMAALAGVLIMTAWRMNEWHEIKGLFKHKVKSSLAQFLITMLATVVFDLTVAIVIGVFVSMILFVVNNADLSVESSNVEFDRIDEKLVHHHEDTKIIYLSGPIFFGTQEQITNEVNAYINDVKAIIFSMRGVPSIDDSGIHELEEMIRLCRSQGIEVIFCGIQKHVIEQMYRQDFLTLLGEENMCWDVVQALRILDEKYQ